MPRTQPHHLGTAAVPSTLPSKRRPALTPPIRAASIGWIHAYIVCRGETPKVENIAYMFDLSERAARGRLQALSRRGEVRVGRDLSVTLTAKGRAYVRRLTR